LTPKKSKTQTNIVLSNLFRKSTIKFSLLLIFSVFLLNVQAQVDVPTDSLTVTNDTIKIARDSVAIVDSVKVVPKAESDIKAPITYSAKDSMRFSLKSKMIYAYGDAKLGMEEMSFDAGYIVMNMDSNYIYAQGIEDENGDVVGSPVFKEGSKEYKPKTIKYNTKTKKGFVTDVVTEENGGYLHGGKTKMQSNNEIHIDGGKYTTCDADHPHFYVKLTRAKVIPEEKIITGPFYFVLSDIPVPVGLPFGFFPSQENRTSGVIIPSYGEEKRRGFFLQDGGYYWAASKNFDLTVLGSIFSSGSWTINARSKYKKRYKYGGNFDISYQKVIQGEKEIPEEYSENTMFWVKFNYARDAKANPTSTFNASLNFGSTQHRRYNYDYSTGANQNNFANNNASSSVAFTKTFPGTPFNFSANINATQNLSDSTINLTLPTLTFNMNKQFPFKRKEAIGSKKWYEQISVGFSSQLENKIQTKNSVLFTEEAVDQFENGFKYNVPISTSLKVFKYFNLSPGISYNGRLYTSYLAQRVLYEGADTLVYNDTLPEKGLGLYHVYDFAFSAPFSTKLYGIKEFKKGRIAAIRHVMSPSVSFSYRPDFGRPEWGFYERDRRYLDDYDDPDHDYDPDKIYSVYGNGIYGAPPKGKSGSVGFSLDNNFEMKTHSKDTTEEYKKIVLLNSLRFSTSYNLAAEEFHWSDLNVSANTKLFKQVNVTYSGAVDLYRMDPTTGKRTDTLLIISDKALGHLKRSTISLSGSINSDTFKKKDKKSDKEGGEGSEEDFGQLPGEGFDELDRLNKKEDSKKSDDKKGDYNFKIPWNLSINYSLNYNNSTTKLNAETNRYEYKPDVTQTLNLNGGLSLTPKWKVTASGSYDFEKNELTHVRMSISRDLHCWQMSFNFVPFGTYQSYNFRINVKSSMFQGLEYKKQQSFRDSFDF
jgi:lipopolysaccharide assembly outer membrane protein LptD (OstA)